MTFQEAKIQMRKTGCWVTCNRFADEESCHFYRGNFYLEDGCVVTEEAELQNPCFQGDDWYVKYSADRIDQFMLLEIHRVAGEYSLSGVDKYDSYEEAVFPNGESMPLEAYKDTMLPDNINDLEMILQKVTITNCASHYGTDITNYDELCDYMLHHKKVKLSEERKAELKPMLYYFLMSTDTMPYVKKRQDDIIKEYKKSKNVTKKALWELLIGTDLLLGFMNLENGSKLLGIFLICSGVIIFKQHATTREPNKKYFKITDDIKIPVLFSLIDYFRFICMTLGMLITAAYELPFWLNFIVVAILISPFFFMGTMKELKED